MRTCAKARWLWIGLWLGIVVLLPPLAALAETVAVPAFFVERTPGRFVLQTQGLAAEVHRGGVQFRAAAGEGEPARLRVVYPGSSPEVRLAGAGKLPGRANFLTGSEAATWRTDLPVYAQVRLLGLYPGVDLEYSIAGGRLKSEFRLAPGVSPAVIRIAYQGATSVAVGADGDLVVRIPGGAWQERAPVAWQETPEGRVPVRAEWNTGPERTAGFSITEHDPRWPLVIDPEIDFSTYLGGGGIDNATAVAVDPSGGLYVAGWTDSADFPVVAPASFRGRGTDAFVAKFDQQTRQMVYCTYLGGSGDDRALGVAADVANSVAVAGSTTSFNFPAVNAAQRTLRGSRDAFVARLNPQGNGFVFSTYYGGSGVDIANAVAVDPFQAVYVAGETASTDFPVVGAFQPANAGLTDAFLVRFNPNGTVFYATYLGGSGDDRALGVAVTGERAPYVAGGTTSVNFPRVNPAQPFFGGQMDAFLVKFRSGGTSLQYATTLGGAGGTATYPEQATAVAVDPFGSAYITGTTPSPNFPMSSPNKPLLQGPLDGFVAKFSPPGSALPYSTFLGGSGVDYATGIAVDSTGSAYVTGQTSSWDYPVVRGLPGLTSFRGMFDAFLSKLNPSGIGFAYSTFLGGAGADTANAVAVDSIGQAFVAGQTQSVDFPLAAPVRSSLAGGVDAFVTKITDASACVYSLFPSTANTGPGARTLWYALTTGAGCNWTAIADVSWLTITTPVGTGSANIFMNVAANPDTTPRTATITVAGRQSTLTQAGRAP